MQLQKARTRSFLQSYAKVEHRYVSIIYDRGFMYRYNGRGGRRTIDDLHRGIKVRCLQKAWGYLADIYSERYYGCGDINISHIVWK